MRGTVALLTLATIVAAACSPRGSKTEMSSGGGVDRSPSYLAVVGDFGTGGDGQKAVAEAMCEFWAEQPFEFVVTTGDNIYPDGEPEEFHSKFFVPYECLFEQGVRFRATLGNHDVRTDDGDPQIEEPAFGMPGRRYSWKHGPVSFVMLDSNLLLDELNSEEPDTGEELRWLTKQLVEAENSPWTVVVFHHPVYSVGVYGPTPGFAEHLEPLFSERGVDLVLNGHDHNYQTAVSSGITYVVTGGGGGNLYECKEIEPPVRNCMKVFHFLAIEATESALTVRVIDAEGEEIDSLHVVANE